ncbi:MAG: DUF711 family protein [Chloroflexota bacterium]
MKIRSITYFCNPGWPLNQKKLRAAGAFLAEAKSAYEAEGYEVQTTRLATVPFPRLLGAKKIAEAPRLAEELTRLLPEVEIGYASLGPALPESAASYALIPEAIAGSKNVFFAGVMAGKTAGKPAGSRIHLDAVRACAEVIVHTSTLEPNGFANLRFAALANVQPGAPFFPAAYHEGDQPAFALAMEAADVAVQAFEIARTVEDGQQVMADILEENAHTLVKVADFLKYKHLIHFGGIDFSLAPFPEETRSLGAAVERMGVTRVGLHGSLAAAAILTEAIERGNFPRAGFCGFMQPVLEDPILAQRAAEGTLIVKDLLLYSAVCGTGLDTVPLPGDVTPEQIAALLLDIAALSLRLDKPLTARLLPIPGKRVGAATVFDFGYFSNSRVMSLEAKPLEKALGGEETIRLEKQGQ